MSTTSSNMGLVLSTIGQDSGLLWEQNLNASLTTVDSHNHSSGQGVQIPSTGININSALSFNGQAATSLSSLVFSPQSSLATVTALYVKADGNLYYNDGAGNVIKFTSGGNVNATSSGISSGSATAAFSSGVLVVNSATNTPANIQGGSLLLGNNTAGSQYLTLAPPAAMATSFSLTLPSIPAAQNFMSIDASGNIAAYVPIANGITRPNLAAVGQQVSASCGNSYSTISGTFSTVTNLTVTITTSGRPVVLTLNDDGSLTQYSGISGPASGNGTIAWFRNSTQITSMGSPQANQFNEGGCALFIDTPSAGTYTYTMQAKVSSYSSGFGLSFLYLKLFAYEL